MIGRPERNEAAEFHWRYIDQVNGDDPVAVLERQSGEFEQLLAELSEEQSHSRYAPGKWTIRESMGHVTDTERIFSFRTLWFARGLPDALPGFDQDIAVAGAEADCVTLSDHLKEFHIVRQATLAMLRNLPEAAWMRGGSASGSSFTVRAMAFLTAGHAEHHLKLFREKYLA